MQSFEFTIRDILGIHARTTGMLAKLARDYQSDIVFENGQKKANLRQIFDVMDLEATCGDTITVRISGVDELAAAAGVREFLEREL